MTPDFETALLELVAKYADDTSVDDMISALELQLMSLQEQAKENDDGEF